MIQNRWVVSNLKASTAFRAITVAVLSLTSKVLTGLAKSSQGFLWSISNGTAAQFIRTGNLTPLGKCNPKCTTHEISFRLLVAYGAECL